MLSDGNRDIGEVQGECENKSHLRVVTSLSATPIFERGELTIDQRVTLAHQKVRVERHE